MQGEPGSSGAGCVRLAINTDPELGIIVTGTPNHDVTVKFGGGQQARTMSIRDFDDRTKALLADDGPVQTNARNLSQLMNNELANLGKDLSNILDNLAQQTRDMDSTQTVLDAAMVASEQLRLNLERAQNQQGNLAVDMNRVNLTAVELLDLQDQAAALRTDTTNTLSTVVKERSLFDSQISEAQTLTDDLSAAGVSLQDVNVGLPSDIESQLGSAINMESERATSVEDSLAAVVKDISELASVEVSNQEARRVSNANVTALDKILKCNTSEWDEIESGCLETSTIDGLIPNSFLSLFSSILPLLPPPALHLALAQRPSRNGTSPATVAAQSTVHPWASVSSRPAAPIFEV